MFQQHVVRAGVVAVFSVFVAGFCGTATAADSCDRACMTGLITQYVDALVAKDPSKLPLLADNIKVTEDSKAIKLGDGLWKTVTGKGTFRHDYLDVKAQVAAAHVVVLEGETQALTLRAAAYQGPQDCRYRDSGAASGWR